MRRSPIPLTFAVLALGCLLAPPPSLAQPARSLKEAQDLLNAGKADEALAALSSLESALGPAMDRKTAADLHLVRAAVFWSRSAFGDCEREAKTAETLAKGIDPGAEAQALWLQGNVAFSRGDEPGRFKLLERAAPLARQSGDGRRQAMVSDGFCRHFQIIQPPTKALAHCDDAIRHADRGGDTEFRIMSRALKATVLLSTARYDEALSFGQDAYDLALERTDVTPRVRAAAIWTLAQVNSFLRNLDVAIRLLDEAIEVYRKLGFTPGVMNTLSVRKDALVSIGDNERALADGAELLRYEGSQPSGRTPETLSKHAMAFGRGGRPADALATIAEAESRLETQRPNRDQLYVYTNLGMALASASQYARALPYFIQVIDASRTRSDPDREWRAMWGYGRALIGDGRAAEAIPWLESAIALSEHVRLKLPDVAHRAAYMSDSIKIHESLVEAVLAGRQSIAPADAERTLEIAEAARARAMADQLTEARLRAKDSGLRDLMRKETGFSARLTDVQRRLLNAAAGPERQTLLAELSAAETDYANYVSRLRRDQPAYARISHPVRLTAREIQQGLRPGEAFVEYVCADATGFAWIVTRDALTAFRIPGRAALDSSVRLMLALSRAGDAAATRKVGAALYAQLLAPGAPLLSGATRLVISPDGPLLRLPFALLSAEGRGWLVQDYALSLAPSATTLIQLAGAPRVPSRPGVLAFAASPGAARTRNAGVFEPGMLPSEGLPNAAREARDVTSLFDGSEVHAGAGATERDVKAASSTYRVVHFATHAVVDEVVPRRSAIVLQGDQADDGLLQPHEIAGLQLGAELIVLSACQSYAGRSIRGEGLSSLARAFLQGGARAVVASIWDVDDRTSPDLMRAFYAALAGGAAPDAALRIAQLQMLRSGGDTAAPLSWAGFTVMGAAADPLFPPRKPAGAAVAIAISISAGGMLWLAMSRRGRRAS